MTPEEFKSASDFDQNLKPGDRVEFRWTNSGRSYRASATLKSVSKSSVRGTLDKEVPIPGGSSYPAGHEIVVPRLTLATMNRWSGNNGVFPVHEAVEQIVDGLLAEGRDRTARWVLTMQSLGHGITPMGWWPEQYGRPSQANLDRYMQKFIDSMKPGGPNAHLGIQPTGAQIHDYTINGPVLFSWKA